MKVTITQIQGLLKRDGWAMDHRRQGWNSRYTSVYNNAISFVEYFNPGTKEREFKVTYYTGNPHQYWDSDTFPDIKQAMAYANAHLKDAFEKIEYDEAHPKYAAITHRVARRYIKKVAGFRFDPHDLPEIGAQLVDIRLEQIGDLRQGDSVCVLAFDDTKEIRIFVGKPPVEKEDKTACMINDLTEVPPVGAVITRVDWDGDSIVEMVADGKHMTLHVEPPGRQYTGDESGHTARQRIALQQRIGSHIPLGSQSPQERQAIMAALAAQTVWVTKSFDWRATDEIKEWLDWVWVGNRSMGFRVFSLYSGSDRYEYLAVSDPTGTVVSKLKGLPGVVEVTPQESSEDYMARTALRRKIAWQRVTRQSR